jgi:predicted amidohydrolase
MQNLNVTLVQCKQFWEDKSANLAHFDSLLEGIETTDLILLPEMFHTSFSMNPAKLAESMEDSLALNWLKKTANEKNCAIYTSFIAQENDAFFNRGIFMFPTGNFEIYDKRKLFSLAGEHEVFNAGAKETIVEYLGWKIQLQICYDLRFPEIARNRWISNENPAYDVMLYIANWPEKRSLHWKTLLVARAIENQSFVVGVNRVGKDGKALDYNGDSAVIDAVGNQLVTFESALESIKKIELDKTKLNAIRKQLSFLKDVSC